MHKILYSLAIFGLAACIEDTQDAPDGRAGGQAGEGGAGGQADLDASGGMGGGPDGGGGMGGGQGGSGGQGGGFGGQGGSGGSGGGDGGGGFGGGVGGGGGFGGQGGSGGQGGFGGGDGGGGFGGGGGVGGGYFDWVFILDYSTEENQAGTPGADICGVSAVCNGRPLASVAALLSLGDGELCDSIRAGCPADRTDPNAARDNGAQCEPASAPSDYVSLGMGGVLAVQFAESLRGCTAEVVELVGNQDEGYEVYVCTDSQGTECLNESPIGVVDHGGSIVVLIP